MTTLTSCITAELLPQKIKIPKNVLVKKIKFNYLLLDPSAVLVSLITNIKGQSHGRRYTKY